MKANTAKEKIRTKKSVGKAMAKRTRVRKLIANEIGKKTRARKRIKKINEKKLLGV